MHFETDRLSLNIINLSDNTHIFETLNNQHTAEIISFLKWPMTMNQADNWCIKAIDGAKKDLEFLFIARDKNSKCPIGGIGVHRQEDKSTAEIGYWVSESKQGKGYATEMLTNTINYAFSNLNISKLFATTDTENPSSGHLLKKSGFVFSGNKEVNLPNGTIRRSYLYELTKELL